MMPEFEKAAGPELIAKFWGPMNRQAQPEEMAWPLAFLNSDAASFITGSTSSSTQASSPG